MVSSTNAWDPPSQQACTNPINVSRSKAPIQVRLCCSRRWAPWLGSAVPIAEGASVQVGEHLIVNREPDSQLDIANHGSQHQMS